MLMLPHYDLGALSRSPCSACDPACLLNGLLLFVALVPYTIELLASYATARQQSNQFVAAVVYNGTYLLIAVAFNLM